MKSQRTGPLNCLTEFQLF